MSLATKYRPTTLDDVTEQNITTSIIKKVIEKRSFKNVYGFFGKSGSGKTTIARIFANSINNGIGSPIELDCSSNNSVDDVRSIIENANKRALVGEYKVYILDESHMFSISAWNALLKLIEDCPKYTILIFCSTEPNKFPATVLNRMQRFNFSSISMSGIKARLEHICKQENFTNYTQTCELISKIASGSMRDAITYLEQCADYSTDLSLENTRQIIGNLSYETMFKLTWALTNKVDGDIITIFDDMYNIGTDIKNFIDLYLSFIIDLKKYTIFKDIAITAIPDYLASKENAVVQYTIGLFKDNFLSNLIEALLDIKLNIKYDTNYKNTIQASLLKFIEEN